MAMFFCIKILTGSVHNYAKKKLKFLFNMCDYVLQNKTKTVFIKCGYHRSKCGHSEEPWVVSKKTLN